MVSKLSGVQVDIMITCFTEEGLIFKKDCYTPYLILI